jgi:drug/metabolite transporter (DMT)-like permease
MLLCFVDRPQATATAPDPATGNLFGLLSAIAWALTLIVLRHAERDAAPPGAGMTAVVAGNLIASAGALPFAWPFPAAPVEQWATLVYLGIFQIGLAYLCLTLAIRRLPALDVSLLLLVEPALNPVWTWLIRGEEPGGWTIAGGAIILAATGVKSFVDAAAAKSTTTMQES